MNNTKVSIIVPLFNAEKFAKRCIESVLMQTFKNYELILIDDGSKDKTGEICDKYAEKDTRIKVIHKNNGGVSSARNTGLDMAKGEWITFLDADDWIEPNFLLIVDNNSNDSIDWIFAQWRTIWDNGLPNEINNYEQEILFNNWEEIKNIWDKMANMDICRCPWGKFFRRSVIESYKLRFDNSLKYGEDTVFNYEYLINIKGLSLCKKEYSHYIFHQNYGVIAVIKYKCTPQGITTTRNKIFEIFFNKNIQNLKFERLFFFGFTMMEHCYLGKKDEKIRRDYYKGDIQKKLEKHCLSSINYYDRIMYYIFKYIPHFLTYPIAKQYLKFR
jgi:glycosyltransferase involved in cell wall biosynthesis